LLVVSERQGPRGEILLSQWMESGQKTSAKYKREAGTEHMDEAGLLRGRGRIGCRRAFKLPQLRQRSIIFLDLETESGTPFYRMQGEYRRFSRYRAIAQEGSPVAERGSAHCPVLTTLTCSQLVERKRKRFRHSSWSHFRIITKIIAAPACALCI